VLASTAKGNMVWLCVVAEAVRDQSGNIKSFQGAIQDITESKEAAGNIRRLSEELTSTLENLTDAFITVDQEARLTYVNAEAERLLGEGRTKLLGKVLWEQFPTSAGTVFQVEYERALAKRTSARFEAYSKTISAWVQVSVYPSAYGLAIYFRDISESRNAREALVESEERYRLLFETSGEAIIEASSDGRIRRANRVACSMFGRSAEALCSVEAYVLVSPADRRLQDMVQERLKNGGARGELTMIRTDGTSFEAEVTTSTYRIRDGTVLTNIVVRDITERLQLQREIVALNSDLSERVRQRTSQLEAANTELRGFAHVLAHDLQQPVCAIKAFSAALDGALAKRGADQERHYSSRIQAASQQMLGFIEALLSLAKISQTELRMSMVDLSGMATSLLDELHQQDRSRKLISKVQPGLRARGDPRLLRMLLANLLSNAWKFTARRDQAEISFTADAAAGNDVVYCIRDNGAGFDMAYAHKLFGNFQRLHTDAEFPGTGIGLANVRRIVVRHEGRVWAESREGEGATFSFTLHANATIE
jgi:PAS domain S-box-containing protein